MKWYLIRHPETEQHLDGIQQTFQSQDYTLEGSQHFEKAIKVISQIKPIRIYTSDAPRCKKLAQAMQKITNCEIIETPLLRDKSNGDYEGKKNSELDWTEINKLPFLDRKAPQGESIREVIERLNKFLDLTKKEQEKTIIVSHSVPLRLLVGMLKNKSAEESIIGVQWPHGEIRIMET